MREVQHIFIVKRARDLPPQARFACFICRRIVLYIQNLFLEAGLTDMVTQIYPLGMRDEARNQKGLLSIGDYLHILGRMIVLLFKDSETRGLLKYAGSSPRQYFEYMGYGLFVGRKPPE